MDSWTLQGDSYSFRSSSAPRVFSLRHCDGTPNHVEILDITNIPSHRSAISETTCLCDIFGDDCESRPPSLSSSPTTGAFVHAPVPPPRREAAGPGQSSESPPVLPPVVDELNDSTSSYHTAPESFEDSREKLSPPTQRENNYHLYEGWESGALATAGNNSSSSGKSKDISPRLEQGKTAPTPGRRTGDSSPEVPSFTWVDRTPSPGYSNTTTPSPDGRGSASSVVQCSPAPSPQCRETHLSPEPENRYSSPSSESVVPVHSIEVRDRASSPGVRGTASSPDNTGLSLPETRVAQCLPEPRNINPLPELIANPFSPDYIVSFEPRVRAITPEPKASSPSSPPTIRGTGISPQLGGLTSALAELNNIDYSPEFRNRYRSADFRNRVYSLDNQVRVSLPDLFRRTSTPELEDSISTPELEDSISTPELEDSVSTAKLEDSVNTHELIPHLSPAERDLSSSEEAMSTISTPAPRYTPPTPVTSSPEFRSTSTTPELGSASITLELRSTSVTSGLSLLSVPTELRSTSVTTEVTLASITPSSELLRSLSHTPEFRSDSSSSTSLYHSGSSSSSDTWTRTPSRTPSPETRYYRTTSRTPSPETCYNRTLSRTPSPEVRYTSPLIKPRSTAQSPAIRITSSTPEIKRRDLTPEVPGQVKAKSLDPRFNSSSPHPRSYSSSPQVSGISYSILSPEARELVSTPEINGLLSSPEPRGRTHLSPEMKSTTTTKENRRKSLSPESIGRGSSHGSRDSNASPEITGIYSSIVHPPETRDTAASPEPPRYKNLSPPKSQTVSPYPTYKKPSPPPRYTAPSPGVEAARSSSELNTSANSPGVKSPAHSPECRALPGSPGVESPAHSNERRASPGSPGVKSPAHSPECRALPGSPGVKSPAHSPERRASPGSHGVKSPAHSPECRASPGSPERCVGSLSERLITNGTSNPLGNHLSHDSREASPTEESREITSSPVLGEIPVPYNFSAHTTEILNFTPEIRNFTPEIRPNSPDPTASSRGRSLSLSPDLGVTGNSPVQRLDDLEPKHPASSLIPDLSDSSNLSHKSPTPEHPCRETSPNPRNKTIERLTEEDMAHRMGKEDTPSPPLTRFTPVHIIPPAPGRPHGHWGNRSHSPPETQANKAIMESENIMESVIEAVTSRGRTILSSVDSNIRAYDSQAHLEKKREEEREREREREREEEEEEEEREREREEEEEEREMLWEMQERDRKRQRERERNREMEEREKEERERERERQREEERERAMEREREWQAERESERERERQGEERVPGKGEGRQEEASYKGEQVDLSFSARNRKRPASHNAAPKSRESRQGMPAARSYSESLLTTRLQQIQQLQKQQHGILHRAAHRSQPETARGGPGPTKKLQTQPKHKPAIPQLGSSVPGRISVDGPSSSMGSELDEEDNEVKWFSDVAFRSLSSGSPQVDYLDMYNSSHRSSTGASQPSTQDSPAGANAAWLAYADLRGSAPRLDNEDFPVPRQQQQPTSGAYYPPHDGLDPSNKYEMGSFECVDVAVEREEPMKVRRGVPKRQIQLKRRNTAKLKLGENSDGSPVMVPSPIMVPVVPVATVDPMDSPSLQRHNRATLQRQHSTPAALKEACCPEPSPEPATERTERTKRKGKLQKSLSLDETCTKTKMVTCLIKNILSKKMQKVGKQTDQEEEGGDLSPSEDKTPPPPESEASTLKESPKPETQNLSSSKNSDDSLSSEHLAVRRETSPNTDVNRQQRSFEVKSSISPMNRTININSTSPQQSNKRPEPTSTTPEMSPDAHFAPVNFTSPQRKNEIIESHSNRSPNHVSPGMRSEPPTTSCPQRNSDRNESPSRNPNSWRTDPVKPEMRSELVFPFESKKPTEKNARMGGKQTHDSKQRDEKDDSIQKNEKDDSKQRNEKDDKQGGDSADAAARNTGVPASTRASSTQAGMTNTKLEYHSDSENYKHLSVKSTYMSKTPEITLKPSPVTEKNKTSSLNVSLLPEMEINPEVNHETASPGRTCQRETTEEDRRLETSHRETRQEDRRVETSHGEIREEEKRVQTSHRETREEEKGVKTLNKMNEQTDDVDANRKGKAKAPLRKVRDVRRLVKNTYNLSFKTMPAPEKEERREERREEQREERREERKEERREERREEKKDDRVESREEKREERCEEIIERREERKEEKLPPPPISLQKEEKLPPPSISLQKEEKLPPPPISLQKEEKLPPTPISLQKEEKLSPTPISLQKEEKLPPPPISLQKEEKLPPTPISLQKEEKLPPTPISLQKEEKLPPTPISLQKEEKPMPRPQPMQIEYKAVSWRENKNKTTTSNKTDRETSRGKPKPDSLQQVSTETAKEPQDLSDVTPKSCATEDVAVTETELNQHKTPVQDTVKTETGNTKVKPSETESPRVTRRHRSISESSDKPEVVRRDTKPPMLGSSPKLSSKDRGVSSASLVLQHGSNKPKSFSALAPAFPAPASPAPASPAPAPASPAPASSPAPAPASTAPTLASSPSPGPKASPAPASPPAPTSSPAPVLGTPPSTVPTKTPTPTPSHSVSILVKEKGYQADIGSVVSEAVSEAITRSGGEGGVGGRGVPGKHINRIEIPLQTRGPSDGGTSDSHKQRTYSSSSTSSVKVASSVSSSSTVKEASSFSSTSVNASTSASSSVNALTSASSFSSSSVNASASSSHTHSVPNSPRLRRDSAQTDDSVRTTTNQERVSVRATVRDIEQRTASSPPSPQKNTQEDTAEKETVKKSTYSPKLPVSLPGSPALMRRYRPQVIEVKSLSKEIHKQDKQEKIITSSTRPQTIEVHSIANGPPVAPKPKFRPTDGNSLSNETQQKPVEAATSSFQQHTEEERPVPNEKPSTSATTIHRHLSNDSTPASNYNKKLSVSAVSSYRPPPTKTTIIASFSHKPASTTAHTETSNEASTQGQGQAPSYTQRPTTLTVSAPAPAPAPTQAPAIHSSQSAVVDITSQLQHTKTTTAYPQEQTMPVTFNNTTQPATVSTNTQAPVYTHPIHTQAPLYTHPIHTQAPVYTHPIHTQAPVYTHHVHTQQPIHRSLSSDRPQRADDLRFYASDDPPSYDERESFSPLHLPELPQRKLNRCHPSSSFSSASFCPPPCSCTSGCPSHGLTPPHHHHSPQSHTPPFPSPSHSPGQALAYSMGGQPPLRPHQCRADPQPLSSIGYQPSSPKSSTLPSPTQPPPGMYQSLHQSHPSMLQPCLPDHPLQHTQHMDPRRAPPLHRSPQGQPPVSGGPYSDHSHSHSPNLPPMDPQYLCSPQSLGPSYGSEYGSLSGSDYPDSTGGLGYGQTPRRVLMDPDTGKYFYIEVPVQPLRKMLFDPETGQYVEVLIPQSTMSHSGLYPPSAAPYSTASAGPYSSIHNPNMYAPAPQYLPYGPPPPAPHPQSQPQPPRHPEAPAPGTMHQNGAQVSYGSPGSQGSKPEPQSHAPLDQSYLESMYYVPTGMNASPPDCYHKQPSSLPNTGGKRA